MFVVTHAREVSELKDALIPKGVRVYYKGIIMSVCAETVTLCHASERI